MHWDQISAELNIRIYKFAYEEKISDWPFLTQNQKNTLKEKDPMIINNLQKGPETLYLIVLHIVPSPRPPRTSTSGVSDEKVRRSTLHTCWLDQHLFVKSVFVSDEDSEAL